MDEQLTDRRFDARFVAEGHSFGGGRSGSSSSRLGFGGSCGNCCHFSHMKGGLRVF